MQTDALRHNGEEDREHEIEQAGRPAYVVRGREGFSGDRKPVSPNAKP
jgi:hypothetical protein